MAAQSRRRAARSWFVLPIVTLLLPMAGSPLHPRTSSASNPTAVLDPALTAAMAVASSPLSVVVTFRKTTAPSLTDVALLKQTGISQGFTFKSLPIAGVVATPAQINALAAKPEVRSLYLNAPLTFFNHEAREITGVSRAQSYSGMTAANGGLPLTGHGTTVLINDSGVDGTHGDLQYGSHLVQNTLGTTNLHAVADVLPVSYVEGVPNTDTNSGHGTHCAGIVGGTGAKAGGFYAGVAPDASLVGYGSGGALLVLDALGGFDYAMTKKDALGIDVISNSWGSSGDFAPDDPINVASYTAYKSGMIVVFAAGNEGPAEDTHNPYAKAPWVISVAAGTKEGALADFAPGAAVVRADLAYALVQSLGLEDSAVALNDDPVTVMYNGSALPIEDAALIPAALRGYVNLALNLNIMDAKITVTTGLLNLNPTYHATFEPGKPVTRAAFATTAVRFFDAFIAE